MNAEGITLKCERGVDVDSLNPTERGDCRRKLFNCFSVQCLLGATEQIKTIKLYPQKELKEEGRVRKLYEAIYQVHQWIDDCQLHHGRCSSLASGSRMPRRLLCVECIAGEYQLRLTGPIDSSLSGMSYLALSYCWGTDMHVASKTTTKNYSQYLERIEVGRLPNTIRDAIRLVHRPGMHYLWVDALCINQDDPMDWESEVLRMHDIYRSASVTVAILSSLNAGEGFLNERSEGETGTRTCWYFGEQWQASGFIEDWHSARSKSPFAKRAWVLQEEVLSPRVLFWHRSRLYWRCLEQSYCESYEALKAFTTSRPESWQSSDYAQTLEVLFPKPNSQLPAKLVLSQLWCSLIADFCSRSISVPSDSLPALAGLADAFGAATGWHYHRGLFLEMLPSSLLWIGEPSRSHQALYPSWSPVCCSDSTVRFISLRGGSSRDWTVIAGNARASYAGSLSLTAPVQEFESFGEWSADVCMDEPMTSDSRLLLLHILRYGDMYLTWCSLVLKRVSTNRYRRIGVSRITSPKLSADHVKEVSLV